MTTTGSGRDIGRDIGVKGGISPKYSSSSSSTGTPAWAIALAVIASLVAAAGVGAGAFLALRRNERRAAMATASPLPLYDSTKPSSTQASSSPVKSGHATL